MATLYKRGNKLWLSWGYGKERQQKSTGLLASEWDKGLKVKAELERELAAPKTAGLPKPRSFGGYRKTWIEERTLQGAPSAKDDESRLKHTRELDTMLMVDIKPRHIRDLVLRLRREATLAPRTIRHVFGVLHTLFEDAIINEVVLANPCKVKKGDLPPKVDKNASWRAGAVFSRAEVESLLSDARVPLERRALYALLFLTGCRIGEVAALRWRNIQDAKPLDKLSVAASFNRKKRIEKGVKTDNPREVPVHPTLVKALAQWRLSGWSEYMGRTPKEDDLILPAATGNNLRDPVVHANLLRDLGKMGMRPRRTHDTRRTFISLALADGARKDILKWVTHGPPKDIIDLYTTLPWEVLCEEVGRLNIRIVSTATLLLHPTATNQKAEGS